MTSRSSRRDFLAGLGGATGLTALLASCGSSTSTKDSTSTSGTTAPAAASPTTAGASTTAAAAATTTAGSKTGGSGGELNVFLIPSPSSTAIQSFIPAFEKKTGIKVNFTETPYGEAHQKQLLSYQQKAGAYDVAQFDNTYLAPFGAAKVMKPLDDLVNGSAEYDIHDFSKGQQDYGKYKGISYGLTLSTEPMIQWYRTDIYDALGLKPAETWDEFTANAKAVKSASKGDGAIVGFGSGMDWWWMTFLWSFGGHVYDDALKPMVDTPEAAKATDYMKSLLPFAPDGAITANGDDVTSKFLAQDIGAMIQYSGYYSFTKDPAATKYVGKIGTAKMPKGTTDITHLAGWNIGIPADSKQPDKAWQFLEFVLGKSNAKAYLASGAAAIGRTSITTDKALLVSDPYLSLLSIPDSSRIERYPQLTVWPEMEKAITDDITSVLTGDSTSAKAITKLQSDLTGILSHESK